MPAWKSYQLIEHWAHCYSFFILYQQFTFFGNEPHPSVFDCKSKSLFNFHSSILYKFHVTIQFKFFCINLYHFLRSILKFRLEYILLPTLHWRKEKHQQTNLISSVCWTNYHLQVKEKWFIISFDTNLNAVWCHNQK